MQIPDQTAITAHAFDFDVSQGNRTFTDADGDALTYGIRFGFSGMNGLVVEGTRIRGAPQNAARLEVTVEVNDGRGLTTTTQFIINVAANAGPTVSAGVDDVLVSANSAVDLDATMSGAAFTDADGDAIDYGVSVRGDAGLTTSGHRVVGSLASGKAAEVTITARDNFGGVGVAKFLIAAPVPEPGAPTLPTTPFVYEADQLPINYNMAIVFDLALGLGARPTDEGAALGRVLFHDKRLSITNTVSCESCHRQASAFGTNNRFDTGILGLPLRRNSPGLSNARKSSPHAWFWDMRAASLREVAATAMASHDEMGGKLPRVEAKVRDAGFYQPLFAAAFGTEDITGERILLALEQYVQSILTYRSQFDQACLPMDNSPVDCSAGFTAQELRGQEIFERNTGEDDTVPCTLCHDRRSMHGTWHANNGIDDTITDAGATNPALNRGSLGVFRPPTLRNVALTAPYMHDGRFATLREVIDHYDHGIKDSPNLDTLLRTRSGGVRRMNLSEADKDALEAFLRTLTDNEVIADPKFSDPFQ